MHRTNVELDEKLVSKAMKLTKIDTKKQLVNFALEELVSRAQRRKILKLEGKVKWSGDLGKMRKSRT